MLPIPFRKEKKYVFVKELIVEFLKKIIIKANY